MKRPVLVVSIIKQQFALEVPWYFFASLKRALFTWSLTLSHHCHQPLSYCCTTDKCGFFFSGSLEKTPFLIFNSFFFAFLLWINMASFW